MGKTDKDSSRHLSELVLETEKAEEEKERLFRWKDITIDEWIGFAVFWVLFILILSQVISRYGFNSSITWTEEVARFFLVALTFLGLSIGVRRRAHISVEFFYRYIHGVAYRILRITVDLLVIVFFMVSAFLAWRVGVLAIGQRMSNINVPRSILYYTVMVGFAFAAVVKIRLLISKINNREFEEKRDDKR